ncbi:MAG: bifunctional 3-deoxy-7-phosphoheptulonate synthase/chorismate mutase [Oscillospiraceae bacterium]|nr:bifunctional 3-deoxy-7-phosphoheptulonate synthase/chorismate mutase [Oscillospiraceae bacterium]
MVREAEFSAMGEMLGLNAALNMIAGPCSIESEAQMESVACALVHNGVKIMRGGAYKPRTSPYDFQGLGLEGLKMLKYTCEKFNLLSISELLDVQNLQAVLDHVDIIQIGSRSMHNTALLKEVGRTRHPVLLKRGLMSTLDEFLHALEYIVSNGNRNVIACERGIRTFESSTRNTLDLSSVAILKKDTALPVVVDLSHSLGHRKDIVGPIAKASIACGADGLMVEVHSDPAKALSDSDQQLTLGEFQILCDEITSFRDHMGAC